MTLNKQIIIALGILFLGIGLGYYFAPDVVKKTSKTETKKDVSTEDNQTITKKFDPQTGKVIEEKIETSKKKDTSTETTKEKTIDKEKTQKTYAVKVGMAKTLNSTNLPIYRVGAEVRLPIFSSWLGAEGDIDLSQPKLGAYLRLEF